MAVDSLDRLKAAFGKWRLKKRHVREPVPEKLMARARRVAVVHGVYAVAQAAKIDYCRLANDMTSATESVGRFAPQGGEVAADHKPRRAPARRAAHGLTGESLLEAHAFLCHTVQIWCYVQRLTIAATGVPALLVGGDEDQVWAFGGHGLSPISGLWVSEIWRNGFKKGPLRATGSGRMLPVRLPEEPSFL